MIDTLYALAVRKFPWLRRALAYRIYQFLAKRYPEREWTFMNYGFVPARVDAQGLRLEEEDEPDRCSIQLYAHVAGSVSLDGLDALEVGCGRGGGSSFLARYMRPRAMTAVDFSDKAILFCRQVHSVPALSFQRADAERLPFADGSFDAMVNVESLALLQVAARLPVRGRTAAPRGGAFLFADFRPADQVAALRAELLQSRMDIVRETDITENVLASLAGGQGRRLYLMKSALRGIMAKYFHELVGEPGSVIFEQFRTESSAT